MRGVPAAVPAVFVLGPEFVADFCPAAGFELAAPVAAGGVLPALLPPAPWAAVGLEPEAGVVCAATTEGPVPPVPPRLASPSSSASNVALASNHHGVGDE